MKLSLPYKKNFRALFSNNGSDNPNNFHLLMVYHKSRKDGFNESITVAEAERALKRKNTQFNYVEV